MQPNETVRFALIRRSVSPSDITKTRIGLGRPSHHLFRTDDGAYLLRHRSLNRRKDKDSVPATATRPGHTRRRYRRLLLLRPCRTPKSYLRDCLNGNLYSYDEINEELAMLGVGMSTRFDHDDEGRGLGTRDNRCRETPVCGISRIPKVLICTRPWFLKSQTDAKHQCYITVLSRCSPDNFTQMIADRQQLRTLSGHCAPSFLIGLFDSNGDCEEYQYQHLVGTVTQVQGHS